MISVNIAGRLALRGFSTALKILGRYSFVSLHGLDGGTLVTVVFFDDLSALLKGSKVQTLVQLDCKLVDLKFVDLWVWKDNSEIDSDHLTKWLTFRSSEAQVELVDIVMASLDVWQNSQWNRDFNGLFSFDLLFDWNLDNLDWAFVE